MLKTPEEARGGGLITRLVKAAEGSRELDVLIWAHDNDREVRQEKRGCVIMYLAKSRQPPHDECMLGYADPGEQQLNFSPAHAKPDWPRYTTSLDAALTLLSEPDIRIGIWHGTARAAFNPHTNIVDSGLVHGKDAAPRAVCIVALGARE